MTGALDADCSPRLQAALTRLIDAGAGRIVLDLSGVTLLDADGIAVIQQAASSGRLVIVDPPPGVARVLAMGQLTRLVQCDGGHDRIPAPLTVVPAGAAAVLRLDDLRQVVRHLQGARDRLRVARLDPDRVATREAEVSFASLALHCCTELTALGQAEPRGLRTLAQSLLG